MPILEMRGQFKYKGGPGKDGGPALEIKAHTNIDNGSGEILGGGGGGAGQATMFYYPRPLPFRKKPIRFYVVGVGGGGGQGYVGGKGGSGGKIRFLDWTQVPIATSRNGSQKTPGERGQSGGKWGEKGASFYSADYVSKNADYWSFATTEMDSIGGRGGAAIVTNGAPLRITSGNNKLNIKGRIE